MAKKKSSGRGGPKKTTAGAKKKLGVKKTILDLDPGKKEVYGGAQAQAARHRPALAEPAATRGGQRACAGPWSSWRCRGRT
jgi:hypothetical protein